MKQGNTFKDKLYCTSPFNSLFIRPNGDVASCCAGSEEWGNLKENSIEEIIHSETAIRIRNNVLNGLEESYCKWCVLTENNSCTSQRRGFAHLDVDLNKEFELKTLDIRWSTICNFSCIYCNEDWSSTWAKKKNLPMVSDNLKISENILNYIEKHSSTIDSILVAGGEPLLQMQNEKLFDILSSDTKIMLITNLGIDLKKSKIFNKLSNRKHIDWAVSLENVGNHFEYVRQGGSWELILENLKHIQQTTTHYINFQCIFNILSLLRLKDLFNQAEELGINIEWQIIGDNSLSLDPLLYEGDIRNKCIHILEDVLSNDWNIEYNKPFLVDNLKKLKQNEGLNPLNDVEKNLVEYITNQEKLYNTSNYSFHDLWPEFKHLF